MTDEARQVSPGAVLWSQKQYGPEFAAYLTESGRVKVELVKEGEKK